MSSTRRTRSWVVVRKVVRRRVGQWRGFSVFVCDVRDGKVEGRHGNGEMEDTGAGRFSLTCEVCFGCEGQRTGWLAD